MEGLNKNEKIVWSCWETKTPREVVREAASKGTHNITLAYKFLQHKQNWDATTAEEWFTAEVFSWVLQLLSRKQYFKASHVLSKINVDPDKHIFKVALESVDDMLRDYIVEQLMKSAHQLQKEDPEKWKSFINSWNFLKLLHKSFEVDGTMKHSKAFGQGKDLLLITISHLKSLTIEKVINFSSEYKNQIASYLFLDTIDFSLADFLEPMCLWKILLQRNKAVVLKRWMCMAYNKDDTTKNDYFPENKWLTRDLIILEDSMKLEKLDKLFETWPISKEMIECIEQSDCFDFTKMCAYDALCSFGYLTANEIKDIKCILKRLTRCRQLSEADKIFSQSDAVMNVNQFNEMLAQYCILNKRYNVITLCLNDYNNLESKCAVPTANCLDLWLLYKQITKEMEADKIVAAIYETCSYLPDIISSDPLVVLAMILFDGKSSLFDVFNEEKMIKFSNVTARWGSPFDKKLPHLYSVYSKWKNNTLVVENDINVYQLLRNYKGLDISKVFEFQLFSHAMKAKNKLYGNKMLSSQELRNPLDDSYSDENKSDSNVSSYDMPHFSNQLLVSKYGFQRRLNYLYYLKQNRPCMASQAFLMQQYQCYGRVNFKSSNEVCTQAHVLALQNWSDSLIPASCIAFISMIGYDVTKCRTHITCANIIANFLEKNLGKQKATKQVNSIMDNVISNNLDEFENIYQLLEQAVNAEINDNILSKQFDIGRILFEWQTVIRFANFHSLPLPVLPLKCFALENLWIPFLLFGDVFNYPQNIMIDLSQNFTSRTLAEHVQHSICNQQSDEVNRKEYYQTLKGEQRKISKESSTDSTTMNINYASFEDLWEVMAVCHGQEDPPSALIKAASFLKCPILALMATCYEPDAVDLCWSQWLHSSLGCELPVLPSGDQWDASETQITDEEILNIVRLSLEAGYYKTLAESFAIFYPESPIYILMKFILKVVVDLDFRDGSLALLDSFNKWHTRRSSLFGGMDRKSRMQKPQLIQSLALKIVIAVLARGFRSAYHQQAFLTCLYVSQFTNNLHLVSYPDFYKISSLLQIAIDCEMVFDLESICQDKSAKSLTEFVDQLIAKDMFDKALEFATIAKVPSVFDNVLIADWTKKYNVFKNSEEYKTQSDDKMTIIFWAKCSKALQEADADPKTCIEFLKKQCDADDLNNFQRFYVLRLIVGWYDKLTYQTFTEPGLYKSSVEQEMWMSYISCVTDEHFHFPSLDSTCEYILNGNLECESAASKDEPFRMLLNEIERHTEDLSSTPRKLISIEADRFHRAIGKLLDAGLMMEAWRLDRMFSVPLGCEPRPLQSLQLVESSLKLAEGSIHPFELPQALRVIVRTSSSHFRISESESHCSDSSFEELVLIADKQDETPDANCHLAGRQEADCLSALEALASRSGSKIVKQVASYYRISLQIGWAYEKVLKYEGSPLDFINYLTGRNRMPLAKITFRTYEIPADKIVEYLCTEIVGAVISPHLTRTSGFRQKEHFHYTLWGYPLNSDFEMFLNLRPDDNSSLGRMIMDHLTAFRKSYKTQVYPIAPTQDVETVNEIEDVDALVDEEYQNIEEDEVESVASQGSSKTVQYFAPLATQTDNQSIVSGSTSVYSYATRVGRDKKPQFDVIACTNVKVKPRIRNNIKQLIKGAKLTTKQINIITIELLVLIHECFSSVCDTEGIATTLRSAQTLTTHLMVAKSWRLMVRLLTGLARYTEMAYVFQILKDNHQFEFLLGQFDYMLGQHEDKITNFKQGVLEFLRTHCPGDTELYCLVALHFSMYSEAAEVKKKQANDLIVTLTQMALDNMKALKKKKSQQPEWILLENNDSNRLLLDTAMSHCSEGAELFAKGGRLGAAREMAGLAQLVALQMALLSNPPAKCIFNLTQDKMAKIIDGYLSFMEGLVFAYATDSGGGGFIGRWRDLVYQRAVLGNDPGFIRDISTHRPDIAYFIIQRYEKQKNPTNQAHTLVAELRACFK